MPILDATGRHQNMLIPGRRVELWIQLDKSWADGYEIADLTADGYLIRRMTDDSVLPQTFPVGSVRAA